MGFKPNLVCWARNVATGTVSKLEVRHHPLVGKTREINVEALLPDKEGKLHLRTGRLVSENGSFVPKRAVPNKQGFEAHLGAWMAVEWHRLHGHRQPKAAALEMMLRKTCSNTDPANLRRGIDRHVNHPSIAEIRRDWAPLVLEKDRGGPGLMLLSPCFLGKAIAQMGLEGPELMTAHDTYLWRLGDLRACGPGFVTFTRPYHQPAGSSRTELPHDSPAPSSS